LYQQIYFYQKSILIGNQAIKIEASRGSTGAEHSFVYPKVQGSSPATGIDEKMLKE
jgi:hypothetical protein